MMIYRIFDQYVKDRQRLRDIEWAVASIADDREKTRLRQESFAVAYRVKLVDDILVSMPTEYREVLYFRYMYPRGDWEWQAITNMYMSRRTVYRVLAKARETFMERWHLKTEE